MIDCKKLAKEIYDGNVFSAIHVYMSGGEVTDLPHIFYPLKEYRGKLHTDHGIGMVYQYIDKAIPGQFHKEYPTFSTMKTLTPDESDNVIDELNLLIEKGNNNDPT